MLTALWAWLFTSPLKLAVLLSNRLATWTGLVMVWLKLKGAPDRMRRFLMWWVALNAASLCLLGGAWWVFGKRW